METMLHDIRMVGSHLLIASNPRAVIESCPQELFTAVGYPETITTTTTMIRSGRGAP